MRRRYRVEPVSARRWPSHGGDEHQSLRADDRADPQFRSVVLVDGYQMLRIGKTSAVAVTEFPLPDHPRVQAPPPDRDDYVCAQWGLCAADGRNEPLVWLCDVSYELYPDIAHQLAGRVDATVAKRMRWADMLVVLDVPTSLDWSPDDVRLVVPNDKALWSPWPR
jgi:hypothetical protein